jgi:hypothetical protein
VMTEGGLGPQGLGVRTAQKVRLMHAAVRHILRHDPEHLPWNEADFGAPINQEDMAATMMEFSFVVLEGLRRLGIQLSRLEQESYLHSWLAVGRVMGVEASSMPSDFNDARELTTTIARRQIEGSREGRIMAEALIEGMQTTMPPFFKGFIASAMRFFLENDTITGQNVADMLWLPRADWTTLLVEAAGALGNLAGLAALQESHLTAMLRHFKLQYIQRLLKVERGPGRPAFRIPTRLQEIWQVGG